MPRLKLSLTSASSSNYHKRSQKAKRHGFRRGVYERSKDDNSAIIRYEGEYWGDEKHGRGIETKGDLVYEGEWENGKQTGQGLVTRIECDGQRRILFRGSFKEGKPDGFGIKILEDGSVYEGDFQKGKMSGIGTMKYFNGSVYVGHWKKNKRDGVGKFFDASTGNMYEGEFVDDEKAGHGRQYYLKKAYIQEGAWNDSRPIVSIFADDLVRRCSAKDASPYQIPRIYLKNADALVNYKSQQVLGEMRGCAIKDWEACL